MRVLEVTDLRWVAGGVCSCNEDMDWNGCPITYNDHPGDYNFTSADVDAARSIWDAAVMAANDAQAWLEDQTPETQAWRDANAAYSAALAVENVAADDYSYADTHRCWNGY